MNRKFNHRCKGGLYGRHGTTTPFTSEVLDLIEKVPGIKKISPGRTEKFSGSAPKRVSVSKKDRAIFLKIKSAASYQEVTLQTSGDVDSVISRITEILRRNRIVVQMKESASK